MSVLNIARGKSLSIYSYFIYKTYLFCPESVVVSPPKTILTNTPQVIINLTCCAFSVLVYLTFNPQLVSESSILFYLGGWFFCY